MEYQNIIDDPDAGTYGEFEFSVDEYIDQQPTVYADSLKRLHALLPVTRVIQNIGDSGARVDTLLFKNGDILPYIQEPYDMLPYSIPTTIRMNGTDIAAIWVDRPTGDVAISQLGSCDSFITLVMSIAMHIN